MRKIRRNRRYASGDWRCRRRTGVTALRLRSSVTFSSDSCRRHGTGRDGDWRSRGQPPMRPAVAGQYGRMDHSRHAADLYETSPEAVEMLLRHERVQDPVLEPSAGRGAIVRELCRHGLRVRASDLYGHGGEPALGIETGVDFLSM